jgi:hypothetical protein
MVAIAQLSRARRAMHITDVVRIDRHPLQSAAAVDNRHLLFSNGVDDLFAGSNS